MRLIEQAEAEDPDFGVFLRLAATTGARRVSCARCDGATSTWPRAR